MASEHRVVMIPVAYGVEGRRNNGRKRETFLVRDVAPVMVRVAGGADAPVAARSESLQGLGIGEWRSLDGALLEPVEVAHREEGAALRPYGDNPFLPPDSPLRRFREPEDGARDPVERVPLQGGLALRDVVRDGREAALAAAQAHADRLAFVDGVLHVPSVGPVLWADCVDWQKAKETPVIRLGRMAPGLDPCLLVGGNDRDWLFEEGVRLMPRPPLAWRPALDVLRPEDITYDFDGHSLVGTAHLILGDGMKNRYLSNMTLPHLEAWLRYNEPDYPRGEPGEELADLLRATIHGRRRCGEGPGADLRNEGSFIRTEIGLARWEARRELRAERLLGAAEGMAP